MSVSSIPFGSRTIGLEHPVCVIAEIGINHEGSVEVCARMVEAAAAAGADAIKLQTIDAEEAYVRGTESHILFSGAALSPEETGQIFSLARSLGVEPFTTTADPGTLAWVDRLNPAAHKISSGLLTNVPLIRWTAATGRTLLISTGMAEVEEIDEAVETARSTGNTAIGIFQCTSHYPAPPESLSLSTVRWLGGRYGIPAGYSDHALGTEAAVLSVAAGARMIEKHFTLDTSRASFDHGISLDQPGFTAFVARVRAAETMLGHDAKKPAPGERERATWMHRVVVARRDVARGEKLDWTSIGLKRPLRGTIGLAPRHADALVGRRAARPIRRDEPIVHDALE